MIFGLVIANMIDPGVGVTLSTEGLKAAQVNAPSFVKTLLEIVPINPMEAFAKGSILQIIFFAIMFGFCLNAMGEKGRAMYEFFDVMGHVMIRMTNMVMMYAPSACSAHFLYRQQHGLKVLLPLGKLILVSAIASVLHVIICYSPLVKYVVRIPLPTFFRGVSNRAHRLYDVLQRGGLPANLQSVRRLGASKGVASFSIPLGNTINMDGTAIYMGVAAVFAAEVYGIPLTLSDQLTVMLMGLLASIGTAGVPGAGLSWPASSSPRSASRWKHWP